MRASYIGATAMALGILSMAVSGQSLTGSVVGDDTGSPVAGATVVAIGKPASPNRAPSIYDAVVNGAGEYSMTLPASQYQVCVHGAGLYLDPCAWGSAHVAEVASISAAPAAIRLQKGGWFIVRIHDPNGILAGAEALQSSGVAVFVTGADTGKFPLPMIYNSGRIRDYGAVVPLNQSMTVVVSSNAVLLANGKGAAPGPQGAAFQVTAPDPTTPAWFPPSFALMFPRPTATMIHYYVTGSKQRSIRPRICQRA